MSPLRFPANTLLQLVPARVPQAIDRVRTMVWEPVAGVTSISATAPSPDHIGFQKAKNLPMRPVGNLPVHYGKLWDQRWFRLQLPKTTGQETLYLEWRDQAEATLHIAGTPYYGFDVAHSHAPLPLGTREVWIESVVCQTGMWHPRATGLDPKGSLLSGAMLFRKNEQAWSVLHDFLVLDDLMREELALAFPGREHKFGAIGNKPSLDSVPPLFRKLLRYLDDAINSLDSGGLAAAKKSLTSAFSELAINGPSPAAILTGHAHIDLVWLWPENVGEFKAVHTFATANRLMAGYPEFQFAYSQPASYEAVERLSPAMMREVRKRMNEGRWEAQGATYVESDTILASGEALARSFLIGQESFRALTGHPSKILWLPDVFGYSGCLPQLMKETGVEYFFTTKLTWNAITSFPHSSFVWKGADGSEVLSHLCQDNGYNQQVLVRELRLGANAHRQCDVHSEYLAPTGFGDGGGGVTEEMCERARRVAKLQGVPPTRWGRLDEFFERLAKQRNALPSYPGELYFEYHRGTYTTHGEIKAALRDAERALQVHEAAACATGRPGPDSQLWKRVVFGQFHDYIPGSSIHEVYREAKVELSDIRDISLAKAKKALGKSGPASVFNPLPHPRLLHHGKTSIEVPPLTGGPVKDFQAIPRIPVSASTSALSNDRLTARFDKYGRVNALTVDGKAIPLSAPANQLVIYPDQPHTFGAWDIDRQALSLGMPDDRIAEVHIENHEVIFSRPLGSASHIKIRYSLDPMSPVLKIAWDLDWKEEYALLKALFPTNFLGRDARYGAPFGSVRRSQVGGPLAAEAMWEVPASRWAIVSDDSESEGFFCVTKAKFGFSCRDGCLGLSLVRSAKITNEDRGNKAGSHPEAIRRTLSANVVSDIGYHHIEAAIGHFNPMAPRGEHPSAQAEILYTPFVNYSGPTVTSGFLGLTGGESLQPYWAVPVSKTSWILRLHETLGRSGKAGLKLESGWSARQVDLSGNLSGPRRNLKTIEFSPYKVISIEISRTSP